MQREPERIIEPPTGWSVLNLTELWRNRDLMGFLSLRDVKLRYKQTLLGVTWVVLQPLIAALIFALVFGVLAGMPSDGNPYVPFVYCGTMTWGLFSGILQRSGNSLVGNASLVSKVYFPRIILPLSSAAAVLVDFAISLVAMVIFLVIFKIPPTWNLLSLPFFILLILIAGVGTSLWISALSVYYRDFIHALPFLTTIWLYASPTAYSTSVVPGEWVSLYSLNPAVGFLEGMRWALLGESSLTVGMLIASVIVSLTLLISGLIFFRRIEAGFADAI
jgi:lipopolysaccharide transport system permease protein